MWTDGILLNIDLKTPFNMPRNFKGNITRNRPVSWTKQDAYAPAEMPLKFHEWHARKSDAGSRKTTSRTTVSLCKPAAGISLVKVPRKMRGFAC